MRKTFMTWTAGVALLALIWVSIGPALAQTAAPVITADNARLVGLVAETAFDDVLWALAVSPDGLVAAAGGEDAPGPHPIYLWDAIEQAEPRTLPGHNGQIRALAFHPAGELLASGGLDGALIVWDVTASDELLRAEGPPVWSVAYNLDGDLLALGRGTTAVGSAVIEVLDAESGERLAELPLEDSLWPPFAVAFSPDGSAVLTGGFDGNLLLWYWETNDVEVIDIAPKSNYPMGAVVFSPDGALAAAIIGFVAPMGTVINIVDMDALQVENPPLTGHERLALAAVFHPNSELLASGGEDSTVRLWQLAQRRQLAVLEHGSAVQGVAFAEDGALLVSASRDGVVRAWAALR